MQQTFDIHVPQSELMHTQVENFMLMLSVRTAKMPRSKKSCAKHVSTHLVTIIQGSWSKLMSGPD
jgi:hypothetical protein